MMRSIKSYMPFNTLKIIYYSYFNAIMSYVLYFGGNSPQCLKVFRMQKKKKKKKITSIIIGCNNMASCRNLFRKLEILPLASQYILSLMLFMVNNINLSILNSGSHYISTSMYPSYIF
jgi:hypothetical protein